MAPAPGADVVAADSMDHRALPAAHTARPRRVTRAAGRDLVLASADPAVVRRLARHLRREPEVARLRVAGDGAELARALAALPAVLLLDQAMPGFERLARLRALRARSPGTRTILLADGLEEATVLRALRAGVRGYCPRDVSPALLVKAIQLVRQGEIWIGRRLLLHLIEELTALHDRRAATARGALARLTPREREVVGAVASGASNKEIAARLAITLRTVKAHLTSIFHKLGFSSRLHLAVFALQAPARPRTKVQ